MSAPMKRGTARRLGLELPQHVITMWVEPDLSGLRGLAISLGSIQVPKVDWSAVFAAALERRPR